MRAAILRLVPRCSKIHTPSIPRLLSSTPLTIIGDRHSGHSLHTGSMSRIHLQEELTKSADRVTVKTQYGSIRGGRAANGAAVFLEVPYALLPGRFQDPEPLPSGHQYEDKEYIYESSYCAQPNNDGQAAGLPYEDKVGLGKPAENPLFVNIVSPPNFTPGSGFPVKVYIHGGFLQFGSPHGLSGQAQFVSAERSEVWVNIGYRLSAFGFLACDEPKVNGNFGFKDQWLALLWIRDNIKSFGGDPENVQITGLSAGTSVYIVRFDAVRIQNVNRCPFGTSNIASCISPPRRSGRAISVCYASVKCYPDHAEDTEGATPAIPSPLSCSQSRPCGPGHFIYITRSVKGLDVSDYPCHRNRRGRG